MLRSYPEGAMAMKIVRTSEVEWKQQMQRGPYDQQRKELGGDALKCGLWSLAPGKKSFPFHVHHVTEEAMFVVSGRAKVRSSDGDHAIGPGDYVSFPAGVAHQLINDGAEPLVYLAMSATKGVDVVDYPDSGKVAFMLGGPPNARRAIFRNKDQADYFEGEE
jgi:uncharacterized cupin superfamily protein